jgi:tetratricopeptide (TPR) repeat protein
MTGPARSRRVPVTTTSEEAREQLERGRRAAFHYRFERARPHLDAAIAADPDLALAYIYRGGSAQRGLEERRRHFDRALALRNRVSDGERRMIDAFRVFLLHDDHDHAIEIFRELSDEYTDDPIPPAHLGLRLHHAKERFDEAAEQFVRARERDPDFAPVHAWLGRALSDAVRSADAEAAFLESIRRFPEDADCHLAIGEFFVGQERLDEAVRHFERALEIEPSFEAAREARDGATGRRKGA